MRRFLLLTAALVLLTLFAFQGFRPQYELPAAFETAEAVNIEGSAPEQALNDIYYNVDILGIKELKLSDLSSEFDVDPDMFFAAYGRYSDGRFGIADVFILRPKTGYESEAREALETIKLNRMALFQNFDIYNAYEIAPHGVIFQRGNYYILLMIDDAESAQEIIERYIAK